MTIEIPLHSRKYPGLAALIDDEDWLKVSGYHWCPKKGCGGKFYAHAHAYVDGKKTSVLMHRLILGISGQVDHVSRDSLDNRKVNLRPATTSQNMANRAKYAGEYSSSFKGVSWHRQQGKWRADITKDRKTKHLGCFNDEVTAAKSYDRAAIALHGEYAALNFPVTATTRCNS